MGLHPHLISSEKNLRDYIKNPKKNIILTGWRYELFGKMAEGFRHGDMLITYNPKTHSIEFAEK